MSVKGEQGGSGGGARNDGEKCKHVNARGRLMCTQRVEFSIRQFPLASCLSYTLFSLQLGRCHSITFAFFSPVNRLIARAAALIRTILPLSNNIGALFRQGCSLALLLGALGLFLNGCRDQGVILKHLLKRGNVPKVERTGRRQKGLEWTRGGEAPAKRRMVMPAPRALDVLLLYRLRVIQTQPRLSST